MELIGVAVIQKVASPTLLHPDIHKRNIFVSEDEPSQVTAIIDWQSTSIEPTFVYGIGTPDFLEDPEADIAMIDDLFSQQDHTSTKKLPIDSLAESAEKDPARRDRRKIFGRASRHSK